MSNAPRPAEFRPEVAEIRETRCREEKYSSGEKNSKLGHFCAKYEASKKSWNREEKNMATNAEWMIQQGYKFSDLNVRYKGPGEYTSFVVRLNGEKLDEFELGEGQTFIEFALKKWLDQEHKEPILDEAEKQYLSAVIKPFRDKVLSIKKSSGLYASHYFDEISVYYESFGHDLCFDLPPFEKGTMYKGMKPNQKYTPEELGL